ncbi:hypothetical protein Nepgr_000667 [Nepenthes gracilis]|uniref:Uncharacterized protein n=1 Tax=Nepenthes gracilis TaxID=150966 RepID=A0AAD3P3U0_NEPGR|nr:hypothetical protein Nepgr_000667 [Nepenthes gracilis]
MATNVNILRVHSLSLPIRPVAGLPLISLFCRHRIPPSAAVFRVGTSKWPIAGRNSWTPMVLAENPMLSDIYATAVSGGVAFGMLLFWKETAKRGIFDQKLNRKLVHVSIGLVFMLCWPLFSSGRQGAVLAGVIPGINIIHMLLVGLGLLKDEATIKSMSRYGDHRELLKGPLYYVLAITVACIVYWRTSPVAIAGICNLCAGDGFADIVGRRLGHQKIPYNRNKSIAGSIAMVSAGFMVSVGFMLYFSWFGFIQGSWDMVLGFLAVSIAAAVVESLPISTVLDDNLTSVPATFILAVSYVIYCKNAAISEPSCAGMQLQEFRWKSGDGLWTGAFSRSPGVHYESQVEEEEDEEVEEKAPKDEAEI